MNLYNNTPVLGIIGGMGPYTDGEFISLLRRHTKSENDQGHISLLLDGSCNRPDRTDFLCNNGKSPLPSMIASLQRLQRCGASVIATPCNTAHFFISELRRSAKSSVTVIDMIDEVCKTCKARGFHSVTVLATLGTHHAEIYSSKLRAYGISETNQGRTDILHTQGDIQLIKSGKSQSIRQTIEKALRVSDGVIIGCTELSVSVINDPSLRNDNLSVRIADSMSILAAACIKRCKGSIEPMYFA